MLNGLPDGDSCSSFEFMLQRPPCSRLLKHTFPSCPRSVFISDPVSGSERPERAAERAE